MEFHSDCGEESNDQKATRKLNTCSSSQAKQSKKLGSILNFDKCERFYDSIHPQVLKNADKSEGFHQKQQVGRESDKSEELVKYMSYLPSYLERGENLKEKPFNIGVLDWRLLEKWQNNHNGTSDIDGKHSPSINNTSSYISTQGSSSHCGRGSAGKFVECKNGSIYLLKLRQSASQVAQTSSLDTVNRVINRKNKDSDVGRVPDTRPQHFEMDGIRSGSKGNGRIHKGETLKAEEQVPCSPVTDHDFSERCRVVVTESNDDPGSRHCSSGHQSVSSKDENYRLKEANWHTFCVGSSVKFHQTKFTSDYTHCYFLPSGTGKSKSSQVEKSCSKEIRRLNCASSREQTMLYPGSVSASPSRRNNIEMNSGSKPRNLAENEVFQVKVGISESTKVRNPSPTRRFTFGVSRSGKSSSSNSSTTQYLISKKITDSKVISTSASLCDSTFEKSNATSRARSSPLRRLLDPLLKPKGGDSHHFARSSERNPLTTDRIVKSSSRQRESTLHSVKVKLDLKGCRTDDIGGPHGTQKNASSTMQALLQVTVKNGLPLFTFTVDNSSDILAATVKESSSKKTVHAWVYTFFSFSEVKKKNAHLINQGSKESNHGYISNVAQMKVSDILCIASNGKGSVNKPSVREFVLSSMGARDADQSSYSLPGDELAAIVVKFPNRMSGQLIQDGTQRGLKEPFQKVRNCSNSRDNEGNQSASADVFSATVILPGGHHGVPSKGEPSPLIERWKSGGSCDCGGWDMGCRIRVLANNIQLSQRPNSTESQSTAFKLFSQEEVEENSPMFILSPFEDGIFSVEFNSSLKLIQAFSIGIAVLNSQTSAILSSNMSKEIYMSSENNVSPVEVSAKYVSYPPLSPVGRA